MSEALTEPQVEALFAEAVAMRKADPPNVAMRSCWNCNPAHERLKTADCLIMCFGCGHFYLRGHDLSAMTAERCKCPDDAPEPVCDWCTGGSSERHGEGGGG